MNRIEKLRKILIKPAYWRALMHGVGPTIEHERILEAHVFDTVIDVGANKGQFSYFASVMWPNAKIIAFEPLPQERARLIGLMKSRAAYFDCALGCANETGELHLASRADSSSLRPLGTKQKDTFGMSETGTLRVDVRRLDDVISPAALDGRVLLKIDVQGAELEVLKGAEEVLRKTTAVFVEVSFVELYLGQSLSDDIEKFLLDRGFRLSSMSDPLRDKSGSEIQADMLFVSGA